MFHRTHDSTCPIMPGYDLFKHVHLLYSIIFPHFTFIWLSPRRPGNNICMCRWVVNNPGTWLTAGSFLWDFLRVGWLRKHLPAFQSAAEQDHIRSRVNGNKSVGRIIADPRLLGKSSTLINYFLQIFSTKKLKWVGAKWTMLINFP